MSNKGFGIKEIIILLAVMFVCIILTMVMYNRNFKDLFGGTPLTGVNNTEYLLTEETMVESTKKYMTSIYDEKLQNGDSVVVTVSTLKENDLIDDLKDDDESECSGYVNVTKDGNMKYESYLKCDNYTTAGYISRLDK